LKPKRLTAGHALRSFDRRPRWPDLNAEAAPINYKRSSQGQTSPMSAFREAGIEKKSATSQGMALRPRLISRVLMLWSEIMSDIMSDIPGSKGINRGPCTGRWILTGTAGRSPRVN